MRKCAYQGPRAMSLSGSVGRHLGAHLLPGGALADPRPPGTDIAVLGDQIALTGDEQVFDVGHEADVGEREAVAGEVLAALELALHHGDGLAHADAAVLDD